MECSVKEFVITSVQILQLKPLKEESVQLALNKGKIPNCNGVQLFVLTSESNLYNIFQRGIINITKEKIRNRMCLTHIDIAFHSPFPPLEFPH